MAPNGDSFRGVDLERRILERAARCGLELAGPVVEALSWHAREVIRANDRLKLTTIVEPDAFIERHLGEAFEGAAMLDATVEGLLLDMGSGNGYPGLPLAAARPGLEPLLVEASTRKAAFLRDVVARTIVRGRVHEAQLQRTDDLPEISPVRVLSSRALGGWERILPRMEPCLGEEGDLLLWAGATVEQVARRTAWRRLRLVERKPLPGRSSSWIWRFRSA
jgi:16S rRNA (guanine527-N7)-methyltransferase